MSAVSHATTLTNLGTVLTVVGEFAQSRACLEEALTVRRRVLGNDHPDTALVLNNLGACFRLRET